MIKIYGGTVTEGAQDGVEIGTDENPILFDGMYPALNGQTSKTVTFAIRTDGEIVSNILIFSTILDTNNKEIDGYLYLNWGRSVDSQTQNKLYINTIDDKNFIFSIKAIAYGNEPTNSSPDLRGKLYIIKIKDMIKVLS